MLSAEPLSVESETPVKYLASAPAVSGDLTADGAINVKDVILINKAIYNKADLTDEQSVAADVNQDGRIDASDSLMIMKYILKLIDNFE